MKRLLCLTVLVLFIAVPASAGTLRKGDNGESVRKLQQVLINQGFLEGTADGSFGDATEAAVKEYQTRSKFSETGIITDSQYMQLTHERMHQPEGLSSEEADLDLLKYLLTEYEATPVRQDADGNYHIRDYIGVATEVT